VTYRVVRLLPLLLLTIACGCLRARQAAAGASTVQVERAGEVVVQDSLARIEGKLDVAIEANQTAGRDVNEPWTGRILAVGAVAVPLVIAGIVVYMLAHRWRRTRAVIDTMKGETCHLSVPPVIVAQGRVQTPTAVPPESTDNDLAFMAASLKGRMATQVEKEIAHEQLDKIQRPSAERPGADAANPD
jgi:hypothetical protein